MSESTLADWRDIAVSDGDHRDDRPVDCGDVDRLVVIEGDLLFAYPVARLLVGKGEFDEETAG